MEEVMGTGLASIGVAVLLIVFVFVVKTILLKKDEETDE